MNILLSRIQNFIRLESSAGLVLIFMTVLALFAANSAFAPFYNGFLDTNVRFGVGGFELSKPALLWINDGLMAIFFFLVGLEIKREVLAGELASLDKAILPVLAAIGGMAGPALIYVWFNLDNLQALRPTSPLPLVFWRCWDRGCRWHSRSSCWRSPLSTTSGRLLLLQFSTVRNCL